MDEIPALPVEADAIPADLPLGEALRPSASAKTLVRDALLDLFAALSTGVGLILLGAIVIGTALAVSGRNPSELGNLVVSPWGIAGLLLVTQLPLLYFGLRRRRRNRAKQRTLLALFDGDTGSAIRKGVSAGFAMTVLSMLYTSALQRVLGPNAVEGQLDFLSNVLSNKPAVVLLVFIIAVLAPVCEEIFFRGVIFGSARAAGFSKVGAALSSVLFAIVHVSPVLAPFYATFAVVMCWLYTRTGTLAGPIAAHMTLNGVACVALLLAGGDRV